MVRLLAVVLDHDADRVAEVLLDRGVMHFMNVSDLREGWSRRLVPLDEKAFVPRITDIRKRIEGLFKASGETPYSPDQEETLHRALKSRETLDLEKMAAYIDKVASDLSRLRERQRSIGREIASLMEVLQQIRAYGVGVPHSGADEAYSFISVHIGELPTEREETLREELSQTPSVMIPMVRKEGMVHLLLITMKRNSSRIVPILDRLGWKEIELSKEVGDYRPDIVDDVEARIAQLREEEGRLQRETRDRLKRDRAELLHLWHSLVMYEKYYRVQTYFKKTSRTVMFSGWLPEQSRIELIDSIERATQGRCYIEWSKPDAISEQEMLHSKPPVQLRNPKFLAPFQMLVTGFAVPEYGTIDPTFFVIFAYLVMFGLMFADVGQGLILALGGIAGTTLFKKKGKKESAQNLMRLIAWCGFSAAAFGVLFGSYFGRSLLPPLWFDFHGVVTGNPHGQSFVRDLFDILTIAVYFGIAIIGVGLLFNWLNLVKLKKWANLILEKGGIIGGWIYAGGIYAAHYLIRNGYRQLPEGRSLLLLVGIPAVLLFLKHPILSAVGRRKVPKGARHRGGFSIFSLLNVVMVGIVELLEVFSGYLSNTLSFLRVAGLGIAHVSLMTAFFELARMAGFGSSGYYTVWSVLILIMGNLLVIGLEGLSAGIQSLRLHYYEFFTKFLRGSGDAYAPVSLRRAKEEG
jgi:V/A-type H+-transporting ATPase subunit I